MSKLLDLAGTEILVGSKVAFAMGYRQDMNLYTGVVTKFERQYVGIKNDTTGVTVYRSNCSVVVIQ